MNESDVSIQQIKAARALLSWTAGDLAEKANISAVTVRRYESGANIRAEMKGALEQALQAAGIEFISPNGGGPGVRLKADE